MNYLPSVSCKSMMLIGVRFFLMSCSLNWQHQLCKNPRPNPDIKTLFTDHSCAAPTNGARAPPPANGPLVGPIPKSAAFPPMGAHAVRIRLLPVNSAFYFTLICYSSFNLDSCSHFNLWCHHLQMQLRVGWQMRTPLCHMLQSHKDHLVLFNLQTQVR